MHACICSLTRQRLELLARADGARRIGGRAEDEQAGFWCQHRPELLQNAKANIASRIMHSASPGARCAPALRYKNPTLTSGDRMKPSSGVVSRMTGRAPARVAISGYDTQ